MMVKNPFKKRVDFWGVAAGRNSHESRCKNHNSQALAKPPDPACVFHEPFKKASAEPGSITSGVFSVILHCFLRIDGQNPGNHL